MRAFLGYELTRNPPDHSSLSKMGKRLSVEAHVAVFARVLRLVDDSGLLGGGTLGLASATLEANAATRSIVGRDGGTGYEAWAAGVGAVVGDRDADARGAGEAGPEASEEGVERGAGASGGTRRRGSAGRGVAGAGRGDDRAAPPAAAEAGRASPAPGEAPMDRRAVLRLDAMEAPSSGPLGVIIRRTFWPSSSCPRFACSSSISVIKIDSRHHAHALALTRFHLCYHLSCHDPGRLILIVARVSS